MSLSVAELRVARNCQFKPYFKVFVLYNYYMIPKDRRLTTKLLDEVIKTGRLFQSPVLSLRASKVTSGKTRFSTVASKKYFKTAVERNKIRRRIYVAITPLLSVVDKESMDNNRTFHCMIVAKPQVLRLTKDELAKAVQDILFESRILQ